MANQEHIKTLKLGVKEWNKWRHENPTISPELSHVDFGDEFGVLFNLDNIDLSGAYLESSSFFSLYLRNADFTNASLQNCNCYAASFENSNFTSADLQLANFTLASLDDANFEGVYLGNTVFGSCNLSSVKNLELCEHLHSSIIDHHTLIESKYLPLVFLQGCGLPDFIIDNVSALRNDPIAFNSCFISYSSKDEEFAKRLHSDLQKVGIRCWFAPEDMKGGKKTYDQINTAIRIHEKLLLLISASSMKSAWVATEIKRARDYEQRENRHIFFPISIVPYNEIKQWELFDSDSGSDLAEELRSYHIPDFCLWNNQENYQLAFSKLIEALKKSK